MSNSRFLFGIFIVLIGVMVVVALVNFATVPVNNDTKLAEPSTAAGDNLMASRDSVRDRTGILETPVYTMAGEPLGLIYDAYVQPSDGTILWYSINVNGQPNGELVTIPANEIVSNSDNSGLQLNITREAFQERPRQEYYNDDFEDLINLRDLPGTRITDSYEKVIGEVVRITFEGNRLRDVIFTASGNEVVLAQNETEFFVLPFSSVFFERSVGGESYAGDYDIVLTERQAGALQGQIQDLNQSEIDIDIYDLR